MCDPTDDDRPFDIVRDFDLIELVPYFDPSTDAGYYERAYAEDRERVRALKARLAAEDAARRDAS